MGTPSTRSKIKGVIFDMDGTLTIPSGLSLKELRQKWGIQDHEDVMQFINTRLSSDNAQTATAEVGELEEEARKAMQLQPGAAEVMAFLTTHNIRKAVLTRNTRASVATLLDHLKCDDFAAIITREDHPELPHKPHPAPVHHLCAEWRLDASQVCVVGDSLHDLQCGNSAGCHTFLLLNDRNHDIKHLATHTISSLSELLCFL